MKIPRQHFIQGNENGLVASKRGEGGMITVVFIALLTIMMILVVANGRALFQLHRETKLLEQKQIKRLAVSQTNIVAGVSSPEKTKPK